MASRFSPPCVVLRKQLTPTTLMARPVKVATLLIRGCLARLRAPAWGAQAAESALHEPLRGAQTPPASAQSEGLAPRPGNSSGFRAPWGPLPRRGQLTEGGALGKPALPNGSGCGAKGRFKCSPSATSGRNHYQEAARALAGREPEEQVRAQIPAGSLKSQL